jgi:hypothetical protein
MICEVSSPSRVVVRALAPLKVSDFVTFSLDEMEYVPAQM